MDDTEREKERERKKYRRPNIEDRGIRRDRGRSYDKETERWRWIGK